MIQPVSSSGNVFSSGLPCNINPGSPSKSWLHAYVKQWPRAILLPLQTPLDEALCTCFICSVNNEAVLKALFQMKADELDFTTAIQVAIQTEDAAKVAKEIGLWPKNRSGIGDCAATVSTTASASAPSQEGSVSWTATMLPLWQFRPYRNFVQVQRCQVQLLQLTGHLEAACRKKACSKAQGVRWIDVLEMVKAAPCRNSEVQKLHPGTGHCRRRKFHFYLRLD